MEAAQITIIESFYSDSDVTLLLRFFTTKSTEMDLKSA